MGKFKVGDRVRATSSGYGAAIGKTYTVTKAERFDYAGNDWVWLEGLKGSSSDGSLPESNFVLADPVPAWRPKVGDRVRVTYGHGWNGEAIVDLVSSHGTINVLMQEGEFIGEVGGFSLESLSPIPTPTALTIEAGKFYKTRDGRKVGPMESFDGESWCAKHAGNLWRHNGERFFEKDRGGPTDLVAIWEEPTPAGNDNARTLGDMLDDAKPKFKVGDVAEVVRSRPGLTSKVGRRINIARVTSGALYAACDGCKEMVFYEDELELAGPIIGDKPAIVALIDGTPRPSTAPKVHASQEEAATEASRLALLHPGQEFGVFVLAESKIADEVITKTAVLRAA